MRQRDFIALLAVLTLTLFVINIHCLSLKLDDWCTFNAYASMVRTGGLVSTVHKIVNNEYIYGWVRIQFVSFVVKLCAFLAFGYNYIPHFLLQFAAHLAVAVLLFKLLVRHDEKLAMFSALFFLAMPTGQNVLFWPNTLFCIAPVLLYLLYAHRLLNPRGDRPRDLFCLTAWFCLGQFAGEQMLSVFYATPCLILMLRLLPPGKRPAIARDIARVVVPPAIAAILLVLYLTVVTTKKCTIPQYQTRIPSVVDYRLIWSAVTKCALAIRNILYYRSWSYANFRIVPDWRVLATTGLNSILLLTGLFFYYARGERRDTRGSASARGALLIASLAIVFAILYWTPIGYGVMTGMRGMEARYLYGFGIPIALLLATAIITILRRFPLLECIAVLMVFSYLAFLDCYALNTTWRYQKAYDARVWQEVDSQIKKGYTHLLLVHATKWWSSTISDFSQRYGVQGYLYVHYRAPITFDMDTVDPKDLGKKMAVIQVECPTPRHFLKPLITVYPSYESYMRQQGKG